MTTAIIRLKLPRAERGAQGDEGQGRGCHATAPLHRLASLFNEFCTCFNDADSVILAPVYAAGEAPIEGATHTHLAKACTGAAIVRFTPLNPR